MTKLTLISTIYSLEPVIICMTRLSPSKIILLSEEGADEKKLHSEDIIKKLSKARLNLRRNILRSTTLSGLQKRLPKSLKMSMQEATRLLSMSQVAGSRRFLERFLGHTQGMIWCRELCM